MKNRGSNLVSERVITLFSKPYFLIVAIALVVWVRALFFNFTYLDDNVLILDNINFLRNFSNIIRSFSLEVFHIQHASAAYYRPILTISFIIDAQFGGTLPFFYHLTNILLHIGSACLLYIFLIKINLKSSLALLFSTIFAVHPVLTQAVVWIPGRNDSLLTLFFLSAFIFLISFIETKDNKNLLLHAIFFALGLFTKESMVLFPLTAILYLFLVKKEKLFQIYQLKLLVTWFIFILLWIILRANALDNPIHYSLTEIIKSQYINFPATLLYLGKVFFPFNLSVLPTLQDSNLVFGFLSLGIISLLLFFSKSKKIELIIFGSIWFLVFLMSSFIRPNSEYVADFIEHRIYLPAIGLFIIMSEVDFIKNLRLEKKNITFFCGLYIIILSIVSLIYSRNFANRIVFWENAVTNSPHHPLAHKNLGAMYYLDGDLARAEPEYKKSLELNSQETMVHNNLGLIYMSRKDFQKAEEEYKKELEINPYYSNAYFNYGLLNYLQGKYKEAEEKWLTTIQINSDYVDAYKDLVVLYQSQNKMDKANYYYQEALKRGATF